MTVQAIGSMNNRFIGLSTDTKPTIDIAAGATFFEYDTQNIFISNGSVWTLKEGSSLPTSVTTIDLNQAAGDYTLFTVGDNDIRVLSLTIIIPANLTAEETLTAISIQSTDTTPVVFISSSAGAVANLTADKHLQYNGDDVVATGKLIQLTIAGGATAAAQVCKVFITYSGVV